MKKWAAKFKRGRESIEDDGRSGRPKGATADENVCGFLVNNGLKAQWTIVQKMMANIVPYFSMFQECSKIKQLQT